MVKKSEERSRPLATIQYSWPRKEKKNFRRIIAKVEQVEKFLQFAIVHLIPSICPLMKQRCSSQLLKKSWSPFITPSENETKRTGVNERNG